MEFAVLTFFPAKKTRLLVCSLMNDETMKRGENEIKLVCEVADLSSRTRRDWK
jgi:hypothetical protein